MIAEEIIEKFELQVDDSSELSSDEELALLNKCYQKICDDRPWKFLETEFLAVTDGTNSIVLPTDFSYFIERNDDGKKIVWVGDSAYLLIHYGDRRKYTDQTGVCYVSGGYLNFASSPASGLAVKADYIFIPSVLEIGESPIFPERFQPAIYHLMAVEDVTIQVDPSADHIISKNKSLYEGFMTDMRYYNARISDN